MCHSDRAISFPLSTYEQTWLRGRSIRAEILRRHMPPWAAMPGYGQFANDNSLTLREVQFLVSWVEGLGPRNSGTVFLNVLDPAARPREEVKAQAHTGHWQLGQPGLTPRFELEHDCSRARPITFVVLSLIPDFEQSGGYVRWNTCRATRAWYERLFSRFRKRVSGSGVGRRGTAIRSFRPAHPIAFRRTHTSWRKFTIVVRRSPLLTRVPWDCSSPIGRRRIPFRTSCSKRKATCRREQRLKGSEPRSGWPRTSPRWRCGLRQLPVCSPSKFLHDVPMEERRCCCLLRTSPLDWPTPYIFKEPVRLTAGTVLTVTAYYANASSVPQPGGIRLTISRY